MDAQTLQNSISLAILVFGLFSIWLNWRKGIPPPNPTEAWRELYEQSTRERDRNERENEHEITVLLTKIAVQSRELEILRAELDRAITQRTGVSVSTSVIGAGADVGQVATGDKNAQTKT